MQRSINLGAIALAASLLGLATAPLARAEIPEMTLQVAHVYKDGNIWNATAQRYADAITERTGGKVKVNIAAGGTTGTWQESIEALQIGSNDIVLESVGTLDRYAPLPGIEAFPYLIRDRDHFDKVYYGAMGGELFDAIEEATKFKIIGAGYRGARKLSSNVRVEKPDDLKGVKLRVPPLKMYRMTWELMGASPVPMPALEIYTALQQGVIDGQENPLEVIYTFKWYEHQKFVVDTDHVIGAMTFIFDSARFQSFPDELQAILIEEGEKAMRWGGAEMIAKEDSYRADLAAAGVEMITPDLTPFRAAVAPIKDEFPDLKGWVDRIAAVE